MPDLVLKMNRDRARCDTDILQGRDLDYGFLLPFRYPKSQPTIARITLHRLLVPPFAFRSVCFIVFGVAFCAGILRTKKGNLDCCHRYPIYRWDLLVRASL
jgi:hypothetical protein